MYGLNDSQHPSAETYSLLSILEDTKKSDDSNALNWSCTMRDAANKHTNAMLLCIFLTVGFFIFIGLYGMVDYFLKYPESFWLLIFGACITIAVFSLIVRQKTVYNYILNIDKAKCESYLYYPKWAGSFFNAVAIFVMLFSLGVAILTGSFLSLIGAGALGLGYAGRLLGWKNEINVEQSLPWKEYSYITLDKNRKIIVCHRTNVTLGFELRCCTEARFNECRSFLIIVLRPDVECLERHWDPCDYRNG